jgi:hypothetical protein
VTVSPADYSLWVLRRASHRDSVGLWEAILLGIINCLGESKPHDAILIETDEEGRLAYLSPLAGRQTLPVGPFQIAGNIPIQLLCFAGTRIRVTFQS